MFAFMSNIAECCVPCPTVQSVAIPGPQGSAGTAGNNGYNAFSIVQVANTSPAATGDTVTLVVDQCTWMVPGQNVYLFGIGIFSVVSTTGTPATVCTLNYLAYVGNTNFNVAIPIGSQISPAGTQPSTTGFAASGANSDITSLTGLTTPLTVAQGGTGEATLAALLTALPVQAGSNVLTLGVVTVSSANITANSIITVTLKTPGGTRTNFGGYELTSITPGTPGSFVITAIDTSAATLSACTDTVNWHIIL